MTFTVLLTNDDGPPSAQESPYVFGLYKHLTHDLGFDVKVVLPSSQKSWIGKAFHIKEITTGQYYYPTEPHGYGEISDVSRPLKEGEVAEWVLLDATPASCANVGLYNLYPGQVDYVISGPNLGRNTSAAFSLSSGTIGAALSGALTGARALALSYGHVAPTTPDTWVDAAHELAIRIIRQLTSDWDAQHGSCAGDAQHSISPSNAGNSLYSINIPLIEALFTNRSLPVCWTTLWRNSYSTLFKPVKVAPATANATATNIPAAGPDAPDVDPAELKGKASNVYGQPLAFKWSPAMEGLIRPDPSTLPEGTDAWAIHNGYASVTPLRAAFAEPAANGGMVMEDRMWKV
ncbi:survival protein sure-like phosphatase/nucleotidase [Schizophyllum amplum]|uniref:Survival protein sure-like phosphatase/nucleotidase n=1 Tax=Schizophyllum amplum TaxID=97359 RepID=A0A550CNG4_9AGAR|nr:survival protein sure-like phosphatase/nucleotidase [Auriculariopsis ampla]